MKDSRISEAIHAIQDFREEVRTLTLMSNNTLIVLKKEVSETHPNLVPVIELLEKQISEVNKYLNRQP